MEGIRCAMKREIKYVALVPSYEPDEKLKKVVDDLKGKNFDVVVINDGSDLKYEKFFDDCGAKVISYPTNRGKGYAIKKGIEYVKDNYHDYIIVIVDSDGQHDSNDALNLCRYVEEHPDTLAIGKRLRKDNVPLRSKIGNSITKYVFSLATEEDIYDTQSGLRAFEEQLTEYMLETKGDRFEYEMNVLLGLKERNIKYKEIEIKTIYFDDNKGSHFNTIFDSTRIYSQIIKYRMKSILLFIFEFILFIILYKIKSKIIFSNVISGLVCASIGYLMIKNDRQKEQIFKTNLINIGKIVLSTIIIFVLSLKLNLFLSKFISEILMINLMHNVKSYFSNNEK